MSSIDDPLAGNFSWRWASTPATLKAEWTPGTPNELLRGALMAFDATGANYDGYEADDETVSQLANASTWKALLEGATSNKLDASPYSYSYVYVSEKLPDTLTIWEDGSVVLQSPTNTGIPEEPTATGTYPIYIRYAFNYMSGFNPDGSYYDDPVYWINYFNGGDAVHGFWRSFGFPQSLGCVELPISTAAIALPISRSETSSRSRADRDPAEFVRRPRVGHQPRECGTSTIRELHTFTPGHRGEVLVVRQERDEERVRHVRSGSLYLVAGEVAREAELLAAVRQASRRRGLFEASGALGLLGEGRSVRVLCEAPRAVSVGAPSWRTGSLRARAGAIRHSDGPPRR